MSVHINDILPKEIRTEIPVFISKEGQVITDSIKVYSPTIARIEKFRQDTEDIENDAEILIHLINNFTDVKGMDDIKSLGNFKKYFDDGFAILEKEMYEIITLVVNDGLRSRSEIMNMSNEKLEALKKIDPINGGKIEIAKKEIELNELKEKVGD